MFFQEEDTSYEGEEQRGCSSKCVIQEHQAGGLGCLHYPTYTSEYTATSATTSEYHTRNR